MNTPLNLPSDVFSKCVRKIKTTRIVYFLVTREQRINVKNEGLRKGMTASI